jgi:hypothetical protein
MAASFCAVVHGLEESLTGGALEAVLGLQDPVRGVMLDSSEIGEVAAVLAMAEEGHKIVVMVLVERTGVMSNQLT